jgi:ABC-type arginine transport system permease subunit
MQIAAFIDGMALYFHLGTLVSVIIFLVAYCVPIIGALFTGVMTYYGARYGWTWEWWQAILLAAPGIVFSLLIYSFGGLMLLFQRK